MHVIGEAKLNFLLTPCQFNAFGARHLRRFDRELKRNSPSDARENPLPFRGGTHLSRIDRTTSGQFSVLRI